MTPALFVFLLIVVVVTLLSYIIVGYRQLGDGELRPNYRAFVILTGVIFFVGLLLESWVYSFLGVLYIVISLMKIKQWRVEELDNRQRTIILALLVFGLVVLFVTLIVSFIITVYG